MQKLSKLVSRQDANFKLSPSSSNETSINLTREISALISVESGEVTFKIYKKDFIKAMSSLCLIPKIYFKKENSPTSVDFVFKLLSEQIVAQFGQSETSFYTVSHLKRPDGRFYLNDLKKPNGFNLRSFLIEKFSFLTFTKNDNNELYLNVEVTPPQEELSEDLVQAFESASEKFVSNLPLQVIYYGAPGTGKSFEIDNKTDDDNSVRTTFHPDSDYASFVGAYKPTMEDVPISAIVGKEVHAAVPQGNHSGKEKKIVYKYVPQAFLKAYVAAWSNLDKPYFLIIEEINRGNCAQIFGDLFQLLDRNNSGASSYPIHADEDIKQFLKDDKKGFAGLSDNQRQAIADYKMVKDNGDQRYIGSQILDGELLLLPPNLHIWATMNTSDQSLFPIDSAFKRRWDWEYMPIDYAPKNKKTGKEINWKFNVGQNLYSWGEFLSKINPEIYTLTESSDKQMGYFFAKANPVSGIISEEVFLNKVLFYLWTEVLKDYTTGQEIFINPDTKKSFVFTDFFDDKQNALENFINKLKLEVIEDNDALGNNESLQSSGLSSTKKWYVELLTETRNKYLERGYKFQSVVNNYIAMSTGVSGMELVNRVNKRGSSRVELWIQPSSAKEIFDVLSQHKEEIEKQFGSSLSWLESAESEGGNKHAEISFIKEGVDYNNPDEIKETIDWFVENGIKLFETVKPYFPEFK